MHESTPIRDRLVTATLECLRQHGVRATTTKSIAHHAGVSEGSLYNYFANRSELVVTALAAASHDIRQHAAALHRLVGENTVAANLEALSISIIEFFRDMAPVAGSILGDPDLRSWAAGGGIQDDAGRSLTPSIGIDEVAAYLEREHGLGRLPRARHWRVLAAMLVGSCHQYVYLELLSPSGIEGEAASDRLTPAEYAHELVSALLGSDT